MTLPPSNPYPKDRLDSAQQDFEKIKDHICFKGLRVLEIGCGQGYKLFFWRSKGAVMAVGIDISNSELEEGKKVIQSEGFNPEGVHLLQADAGVLPFKNGSFDLVIFHDSMEHLNNPEGALKEAQRILGPGGSISVIMPHYLGLSGNHLWNYIDGSFWRYLHPHLIFPDFILKKMIWWIGVKKRYPDANIHKEWEQYKTLNKLRLHKLKAATESFFVIKYFRIIHPGNSFARWISHSSLFQELFTYGIILIGVRKDKI